MSEVPLYCMDTLPSGGTLALTDSVQLGDRPSLDKTLGPTPQPDTPQRESSLLTT